MDIKKLILHKYKRFNLNHIETFTYTPESKTQLILGTNGSGKSSLLEQLSPLPPDSKDFYDGGYKEITIEHKNKIYILKSIYDGKPRHSFLEDSEIELNPSGTLSIQKSLCSSIFNMADWTNDVLIGKLAFCNMAISERRKWFSKMSSNDYEYITTLFNNVKSSLRDVQGAIKINRSLLLQHEEKLLSEDEIVELRLKRLQYQEEIDSLNNLRLKVDGDDYILNEKINKLDRELDMVIMTYNDTLRTLPKSYSHLSYDDAVKKVEDLNKEIYHIDQLLDDQFSKHQKLVNEHAVLKSIKSNETLTEELLEINKAIKTYSDSFKYLNINTIPDLYFSWDSAHPTLSDLLSNLESNSDRFYSRVVYEQVLNDLIANGKIQNELKDRISKLENIKRDQLAAKESHETECPNCRHKWIVGYNESVLSNVEDKLKALNIELDTIEKEIEKLEIHKNKITDYIRQYRLITDIMKSYDALKSVWDILLPIINENPPQAINMINSISEEFSVLLKINKLNKDKENIEKLLQTDEENLADKITYIESQIDTYKTNVENNTVLLNDLNSKLNFYKHQIRALDKLYSISINLSTLVKNRDKISYDIMVSEVNNSINQLISPLMENLLMAQSQATNIDKEINTINELKKTINDLTLKEESLKALHDALSPKSGLIAESLIGFINLILDEISQFVSTVWTYKLAMTPILLDDDSDELNYKFKVLINDDMPIDDISLISQGMKEIINLGFKLVIMKYLHLEDYPLYLDEFGKSFDKQHRINSSKIINELIHYHSFNKIFIVSHYYESYGSLANTDIVVLHDANISLPQNALPNKTVIIN